MDVTATLSLGDPLEPARKATAQMLQERERTFSLPQPFYTDERLFDIDMQEIFQKEWLIAGMTCEIPAKGNYLTLQVGKNPVIVLRGADRRLRAIHLSLQLLGPHRLQPRHPLARAKAGGRTRVLIAHRSASRRHLNATARPHGSPS